MSRLYQTSAPSASLSLRDRRPALPKTADSVQDSYAVQRKVPVSRDDRQGILLRSSDYETIRRIFVMPRQFRCRKHLIQTKAQYIKIVLLNNSRKPPTRITRQGKFPLETLDGKFPRRYRGYKRLRCPCNERPRLLRQLLRTGRQPDKGASIKQKRVSHSSPPSRQNHRQIDFR